MFSNIKGDQVDAAEIESEKDSLLVYLGKSVDAQCGFHRVKSVVERVLNNFVFFQVLNL